MGRSPLAVTVRGGPIVVVVEVGGGGEFVVATAAATREVVVTSTDGADALHAPATRAKATKVRMRRGWDTAVDGRPTTRIGEPSWREHRRAR